VAGAGIHNQLLLRVMTVRTIQETALLECLDLVITIVLFSYSKLQLKVVLVSMVQY